jgi:Insertion element 4 transposase N-terminal
MRRAILGKLRQHIPFEMVDEALAETRSAQRRIRDLPARAVVYLLLVGCLFKDLGYRQVWDGLVAGLDGLGVPAPTAGGLTQARRRLGVKPLRFRFDLLRGPAAALSTVVGEVYRRGLLICAIDGTVMSVADSVANLIVFTKQPGGANGGASYPTPRLLAGGRLRHPHHCRRGLRTGQHGTDPLRTATAVWMNAAVLSEKSGISGICSQRTACARF